MILLCPTVKPTIRRGATNGTSVIENKPTNLPCPAYGNPPPDITWFKDGRRLTGNEIGVTLNADGSLSLASARPEDAGIYRCEATNPAGRGVHIIELEIFRKFAQFRRLLSLHMNP